MTTRAKRKTQPVTAITEADFRTHRKHMKTRFWILSGLLAANFTLTLLVIFVR